MIVSMKEYKREVDRINKEITSCCDCTFEQELGFLNGCEYHKSLKKYFRDYIEVV